MYLIKSNNMFYGPLISIMLFFAIVALIIHMYNCGSNIIDPIEPTPSISHCNQACTNMTKLECDGWKGSPGSDEIFGTIDDISCTEICIVISSPDSIINLCPKCVSLAISCEEVDACYGNCK